MTLKVQILPTHGLVYVSNTGFLNLDESAEAFKAYLKHPDYRPGQKHLVDLSGVTDFERDYTKIMALQSLKVEAFAAAGCPETILVYLAPTPIAAKLARTVQKSWDRVDSLIALIAKDEEEAMVMLGFRNSSIAELLGAVKA